LSPRDNHSKWPTYHPKDRGEFKAFLLEEEVRNNSPPPPQRHRLDQSDTFILTGQTEIVNIDPPEVNASEPEEVTIEDLGSGELHSTL
jgi:hypothetical protein